MGSSQLIFGCGSLMSSRDGVRYANSWEFRSQTSPFQDCKLTTSLSGEDFPLTWGAETIAKGSVGF